MLKSIFVLSINVLKMCMIVLLNALLDVFAFLLLLQLLAIVLDDIAHLVHDALDLFASLSYFILPRGLLLICKAHVSLDLISISFLDGGLLG